MKQMIHSCFRARKLDWEQIKFKEFTAEECKKYWEYIQVDSSVIKVLCYTNCVDCRLESEGSGSWQR